MAYSIKYRTIHAVKTLKAQMGIKKYKFGKRENGFSTLQSKVWVIFLLTLDGFAANLSAGGLSTSAHLTE